MAFERFLLIGCLSHANQEGSIWRKGASVRFAIIALFSAGSTPAFAIRKDTQGEGRGRTEWRMRPCAIPTIRLIIILNRFANTATRSFIVLSFLLPLLLFPRIRLITYRKSFLPFILLCIFFSFSIFQLFLIKLLCTKVVYV